jgi:hypothetical protein
MELRIELKDGKHRVYAEFELDAIELGNIDPIVKVMTQRLVGQYLHDKAKKVELQPK